MATYILQFRLTPEGRERQLRDPESLFHEEAAIDIPDVQVLGLYAVLGDVDFVGIVEAPDNAAIARFSLELGVTAGVHIATLPAIPVSRLADLGRGERREAELGLTPPLGERG